MNYKRASHYHCQHKNKKRRKIDAWQRIHEWSVHAEWNIYCQPEKKKALKSVEQLQKGLRLKKKQPTITEGVADAKTMSGFHFWGVALQLMSAGGEEKWECCAGCDNNTWVIKNQVNSSFRQEWTTPTYNIRLIVQTTAACWTAWLLDFLQTVFWLVVLTHSQQGQLMLLQHNQFMILQEKLAADGSTCSDYKSASLLMRWEDA